MQDFLVQATYWHDPFQEEKYQRKSSFLADINNERNINQTYIENLRKLNRFVLVKFNGDTIVQPIATEWFEFYVPKQDKEILPLAKSRVAVSEITNDLSFHFQLILLLSFFRIISVWMI